MRSPSPRRHSAPPPLSAAIFAAGAQRLVGRWRSRGAHAQKGRAVPDGRGECILRPAPSGAARLLATGTLRPAPPPAPGSRLSPAPVPVLARGSLCPPARGAPSPARGSQPHGPARPWGLSAPPGSPSADPPQSGSPVPTDTPSPQVSAPHRLSTLPLAESSGAGPAPATHPPKGPRKGQGLRTAPRHGWAGEDTSWG